MLFSHPQKKAEFGAPHLTSQMDSIDLIKESNNSTAHFFRAAWNKLLGPQKPINYEFIKETPTGTAQERNIHVPATAGGQNIDSQQSRQEICTS